MDLSLFRHLETGFALHCGLVEFFTRFARLLDPFDFELSSLYITNLCIGTRSFQIQTKILNGHLETKPRRRNTPLFIKIWFFSFFFIILNLDVFCYLFARLLSFLCSCVSGN